MKEDNRCDLSRHLQTLARRPSGAAPRPPQCACAEQGADQQQQQQQLCVFALYFLLPGSAMSCLKADRWALQTAFTIAALLVVLGESQTPPTPTRELQNLFLPFIFNCISRDIDVFCAQKSVQESASRDVWVAGEQLTAALLCLHAQFRFCFLFSSLFCLQQLRHLPSDRPGTAPPLHTGILSAAFTRF